MAELSAPSVIPRASLAEDALAVFDLPFALWLQQVNLARPNSEETISETEDSVMHHQFVLPHNYVAGGDIKVRLTSSYTGGPCSAATIDCEVYKAGDNLTLGSDLCATAAQTLVKDTYTAKDFVVTATGLVAGDVLNIKVTTSLTEGSGNAARAVVSKSFVLCDVKG